MNLKPLQAAVWNKAIGNEVIARGNHCYRVISKDILKKTGYVVGPDTIRNFLEERNKPRKALMDVYATYVLGGDREDPKTYQDFLVSLREKPVLERLGEIWKEGKHAFWIILSFLVLIVTLIVWLMIQQSGRDQTSYREIISSPDAATSPSLDSLNQTIPTKSLVENILSDFPFDDRDVVSVEEAQRIMEWLGITQMTLFTETAEPYLSGSFPNGCLVTIWMGNYGATDAYRLHCSSEGSKYSYYKPYYLIIRKPTVTLAWNYAFVNSQLSNLQEDGWFFFGGSIDLNLWSEKNHPDSADYLTLQTFLGGPWLDNRDYEPLTINILAHTVSIGNCAEIEVKLVDFNPYSRYQQAGFFLYYNDTELPSISFKYAAAGESNHLQASIRDGKYSNRHLLLPARTGNTKLVSKIAFPDTDHASPEKYVENLRLRLRIEDNTYFFLYSVDDQDFQALSGMALDLPAPKYIGLAAFQGRPEIPDPVFPVADVIDAKFEYVKIRLCE